jgi:hypothetical protein
LAHPIAPPISIHAVLLGYPILRTADFCVVPGLEIRVRFQRDGALTIWVGWFESLDELMDYVDWKYDDEGDEHCLFANHSGLGWFDHDFQEANFLGHYPADIRASLEGLSYQDSFIDVVTVALEKQHPDWNSLFLLYDCAYDPDRGHPSRACRLRHVGTFDYTKGPNSGSEFRRRILE